MKFRKIRFKGQIDDRNIYDFRKSLDYSIKQQDRIDLTYNTLHTQEGEDGNYFLDKYFEKVFEQKIINDDGKKVNTSHVKINLTKDDELSMNDNVCKEIERLADYILYSPDAERITKKTQYNFYTSKEFNKKLNKELSLDKMVDDYSSHSECDNYAYDEVIDYLVRLGENYKKEIAQKIDYNDYSDIDYKTVVRYIEGIHSDYCLNNNYMSQYEDFINQLRVDLRKLKDNDKKTIKFYCDRYYNGDMDKFSNIATQKKIGKQIQLLRQDQLDMKDKIKGTIYFKSPLPDEGYIDYQLFNFTDKNHIMALLKCRPRGISDDLGILIHDLDCLLKECKLNDDDWKALNMYRDEDFTLEKIAEEMDINFQKVHNRIIKITNLIIKKYKEKYIDWLYLNWLKGQYKKCSLCEEIKLVQYFRKNNNTKDNLSSWCKKCESLSKSI